MSRLAPRPLATALASLAAQLAPATTLARVQEVWEQAAGPALCRAASPTAERGGVLTLSCESSVWAQEIDLMSVELLARLNDCLEDRPLRSLRTRVA